ncbi:hypothetical protein LJ739_18515 [Aestuariibacter halophilus]|uniref:Esterase n=1 Tax=Fluctibacter halophilus TaxID=226011 RepID=A0ABS8GCG7_9ALTE|nr:hypothetical protein [Aestuariibacter halophilus]MCC2618257.1 hypothetical protein [Aestuariibacter halophilus]
MLGIRQWFGLLALLVISHVTHGETKASLKLTHPDIDTPLLFNVVLPDGYSQSGDKQYAVLFDFHPQAYRYLQGMHHWLSHNGEWPWPQTIIVTPAPGNPVGRLFDDTGKTTPLLDFFESALIPAIDEHYRTNGFRIISGFRVNGTLALSMLLNKPDVFDAYFVAAPELAENYAGLLSNGPKKLAALPAKPLYLRFTYGDSIKVADQQSAYADWLTILKQHAPASLTWSHADLSDHYFMSYPLMTLMSGIEEVFNDINAGLAPDSSIAQQGFDAIVEHYAMLSRDKYGFEVSPQTSLARRGAYLLSIDPKQAIAFLRTNQQRFPKDLTAVHTLADAYATLGQYEQAIEWQTQAVQLAQSQLTWYQRFHQQKLAQYQQQLNAQQQP